MMLRPGEGVKVAEEQGDPKHDAESLGLPVKVVGASRDPGPGGSQVESPTREGGHHQEDPMDFSSPDSGDLKRSESMGLSPPQW